MKDEEIIEQAWKEQGVIPDTRANLILCKAVIKITKEQVFKKINRIEFMKLIYSGSEIYLPQVKLIREFIEKQLAGGEE